MPLQAYDVNGPHSGNMLIDSMSGGGYGDVSATMFGSRNRHVRGQSNTLTELYCSEVCK